MCNIVYVELGTKKSVHLQQPRKKYFIVIRLGDRICAEYTHIYAYLFIACALLWHYFNFKSVFARENL